MSYTIRQVCEKTGLSAHTLRYYEREGLLPEISRTGGGIRRYSEEDVECLSLICCLKNTGMPLQEIGEFVHLTQQGDQTLKERCRLLLKHRETVLKRMEEMQKHLDKVTGKITYFSEKLKAYESGKEKEGN